MAIGMGRFRTYDDSWLRLDAGLPLMDAARRLMGRAADVAEWNRVWFRNFYGLFSDLLFQN
jgi:hypothetical protein